MKTINHLGRAALCWSCALFVVLMMQWTASAQTLVHRYSFSDTDNGSGNIGATIADSVGGTDWDGTLPNGGDLVDLPGELLLSAASQQYVQLPVGVLSNYTAVTIDCWATFGTLPGACFLYGFGGTNSAGLGIDYIFCQPKGGRIAISGTDPGYSGEQGTGGAGDFSGQTIHVTSVYNPAAGYIELYTNGVLVSRNNSVTTQMSAVTNQINYIARSLYAADSYMDVALNEFRVWNGALDPLQVASCELAGPDTVSLTGVTVDSIQLQAPLFQLVQGGSESAAVSATSSQFSSPIGITKLCSYTSGDTNILTVNSNGVISAVGQGSATIIAQYASLTSTQTISVVQPVSVLAHRYSFTADASDSVGGAAWDGTLPNGGTFAGNQLQLAAASSQYVQFPSGVISNYPAVTIEAWASFPTALPGNCFFFGFGNTDSGGAGENYIYMQPSAGHIGITGTDPGWQGPENTAGTYGNLSLKSNLHIAAVFNPQAHWIAVYTNGVLAGKNLAVTWQMNQVSSVLNYLARSLYTGDSYMDVNIDEYRIYNGALTGQGIAISDAAGPDSIPAGVTNGPGTFVSLSIQAPSTLQVLQTGQVKLLANYTGLTGWDLIGNSVVPPVGLTISTSDTNVLVYGTDGLLHGVNPGTASVITVYQGLTNTATVTVVQAPPATLVHEYSFNDANGSSTAVDSVGGAAWDGTVMASGTNAVPTAGAFTNGVLSLRAANTNYLQLPAGILSNYTAVTVEIWADMVTLPANCALWSFGGTGTNVLSGGQASGYNAIFCAPQVGNITISDKYPTWYGGQGVSDVNWSGRTNLHVTAVFNQPAGYMAIYTNGILAAMTSQTIPMSSVSNLLSYVGRSLYNADPYPDLNVDEFRIYNGALSPNDVLSTQVLGPNQVLASSVKASAAVSGSNLVISWPVAGGAYSLQSTTNLTSGTWITEASPAPLLAGSQWQVTIPKGDGTKFYRLVR